MDSRQMQSESKQMDDGNKKKALVAEIAGRVSVWNKDGKMVASLGVNDNTGANGTPHLTMVDLAARLREPGHEHAGMLESELAAAAAGGVTSLVCPPDTDPVLDEPGLVEMLKMRAEKLHQARVFPLGALTRGLKGEVLTEMAELTEAGCVGFSQAEDESGQSYDDMKGKNRDANEFVRFFAVPGMTHCAGGPATDRFDAFAALVQQFFTEHLVAQRAVSPRTVACYRDALMLVINKPAGIAVHEAHPNAKHRGHHMEQFFPHLMFGLPQPPMLAHRPRGKFEVARTALPGLAGRHDVVARLQRPRRQGDHHLRPRLRRHEPAQPRRRRCSRWPWRATGTKR